MQLAQQIKRTTYNGRQLKRYIDIADSQTVTHLCCEPLHEPVAGQELVDSQVLQDKLKNSVVNDCKTYYQTYPASKIEKPTKNSDLPWPTYYLVNLINIGPPLYVIVFWLSMVRTTNIQSVPGAKYLVIFNM